MVMHSIVKGRIKVGIKGRIKGGNQASLKGVLSRAWLNNQLIDPTLIQPSNKNTPEEEKPNPPLKEKN